MISLDDVLNREYPAQLRRLNGRFHISLPDLGVVASGATASEAWAETERRAQEIFHHHAALGTLEQVPLPQGLRRQRELAPFLIKAAMVAVVGVVLLIAASVAFTYSLRDPLRKVAQRTGRAVVTQMVEQAQTAALEEMSPEQKDRLRLALRTAVPKLKPFADELRPLFDAPVPEHR